MAKLPQLLVPELHNEVLDVRDPAKGGPYELVDDEDKPYGVYMSLEMFQAYAEALERVKATPG